MEELRARNMVLQEENELMMRVLQNVLPLAEAAEEEHERQQTRYAVRMEDPTSKKQYDLLLRKLNRFLQKIDFLETVRSNLEKDISELAHTKKKLQDDMRRDIVILEDHIQHLESEIQVLETADPRQDLAVVLRRPRVRRLPCPPPSADKTAADKAAADKAKSVERARARSQREALKTPPP